MNTFVVNLFGPSGCGKCFIKGTKVLMYDGTIKNIEEINIGDYVMGDDNTKREVLELHRGIAPMYSIDRSHSSSIIVSANHILTIKHYKENYKDFEIVDISIEDFLNKTNNYQNHSRIIKANKITYENEQKLLIEPYYLGYWLGDGISKGTNYFCTADDEIVNYCKDYAETLGLTLKKHSYKEGKCQTYCLSEGNNGHHENHPFGKNIYNLIYNKHIPREYKTASIEDRLKLIAGLIDSDGSLHDVNYDWINKNKQLAFDFYELINSCGLRAVITPCKKRCGDFVGDYWRICISGDISKIPVKLDRKKPKKIRNKPERALEECFTITPVGEDNYYGFTTNGNSRFVLNDATIVHNSSGSAYIFSKLKMNGVSCELVPEYAKDKVWEENTEIFKPENQVYIFGKQFYRISRLIGKVKYIITDSPILLSNVYNKSDMLAKHFEDAVRDCHNSFNTINYYIKRAKPFDPNGRNEKTQADSDKYIEKIFSELKKACVSYTTIAGKESGYSIAVEDILRREGKIV